MLLTLIILLIFTCRARSRRFSVCRLWPQLNWWSMYMPGHYFASRFLKEIWIIVILIFCDWTSQPQNVQFMFYQFQPSLWKVYSFKNCVAELIKSNLHLSLLRHHLARVTKNCWCYIMPLSQLSKTYWLFTLKSQKEIYGLSLTCNFYFNYLGFSLVSRDTYLSSAKANPCRIMKILAFSICKNKCFWISQSFSSTKKSSKTTSAQTLAQTLA